MICKMRSKMLALAGMPANPVLSHAVVIDSEAFYGRAYEMNLPIRQLGEI